MGACHSRPRPSLRVTPSIRSASPPPPPRRPPLLPAIPTIQTVTTRPSSITRDRVVVVQGVVSYEGAEAPLTQRTQRSMRAETALARAEQYYCYEALPRTMDGWTVVEPSSIITRP